jgi:WD40 repeat protein
MAGPTTLNARAVVDPDALVRFIDALRAAGYRIGTTQYIAAHDLILALVARGEAVDDPARLESLLAPLFCSSAKEQAEFPTHFRTWAARLLPQSSAAADQPTLSDTPAEPPGTLGTRLLALATSSRRHFLVGWLVALAAAVVLFLFYRSAEPTLASVQIHSTPDGADVRLLDDNNPPATAGADSIAAESKSELSLGKTPLLWRDVSPGMHRVRISLAGYFHADTTIEVTADTVAHIEVNLRILPTGFMRIITQPAGASIDIDPVEVAGEWLDPRLTTPSDTTVNVQLAEGTYAVRLILENYEERVDTVRIVADSTTVLTAALAPLPAGTLTVTSSPSGARVFINDVERGGTPLERLRVPAGNVGVRLGIVGYSDVVMPVEISADQFRSVNATLEKRAVGDLGIGTDPAGASVSLEPITDLPWLEPDYTPRTTTTPAGWDDVPTGQYRVKASLPGFEDFTDTLTILPGANDRIIRLRPVRRPLYRVAFGHDEETLIVGNPETGLAVWDIRTRAPISPSGDTVPRTSTHRGLVYNPDSTHAALPADDGSIVLLDAATLTPVDTLSRDDRRVSAVAWSADGRMLAAGDIDGRISLWTMEPVALDTLEGGVSGGIAFSPDGRLLAGHGTGEEIILWNMDTRRPERTIPAPSLLFHLAFSPDGRVLAVDNAGTSGSDALRFWDVATGTAFPVSIPPDTNSVTALAFNPATGALATASLNGDLRLRTRNAGEDRPAFSPSFEPGIPGVTSLCFSPDGRMLAAGGIVPLVRLFNALSLPSPPAELDLGISRGLVSACAFNSRGERLAISQADRVVIWDLSRNYGSATELFAPPSTNTAPVVVLQAGSDTLGSVSVAFAPDGKLLATSDHSTNVLLWDVRTRTAIDTLPHPDSVTAIVFSRDGILANLLEDGRIVLWQVGPGRPLLGHRGEVHGLAFSPDGRHVASASADSTVIVWDRQTRTPIDTLVHTDAVESVAYRQDGATLAAARTDSIVQLWNTRGSRMATATAWVRGAGWLLLLALALLAVPFILRMVEWRRRANQFLVRRATDEQPDIERIALRGIEHVLFPDLGRFQVARRFRRRIEVPSPELDVYGTVLGTARRGGVFTPSFGRRQIHPEYLALVDRKTYGDQQAQFVDDLLDRLVGDQVFITRFYFDGDPRVCFPHSERERPVTLRTLTQRYPEHRLLVFADARLLFSPLTGEREPWAEQLLRWNERALLTPEPHARWGRREAQLGADFVVRPVSAQGLATLANGAAEERAESHMHEPREPFPTALRQRPGRWIERDAPEAEDVEQVMGELHSYLGDDGFFWLAACAVYPALNWRLTLNLGYALTNAAGERLLEGDRLLALARLPWFRHAYMPDWLRLRLVNDLAPHQERQVRNALEALLLGAVEGRSDIDDLEIAREQKRALHALTRPLLRILARSAPRNHAINDYVFLAFMKGRNPERLAVRLPQTLMALLGTGGKSAPARVAASVERMRWALLAAVPLAILLTWGGAAAWRLVPETTVKARSLAIIPTADVDVTPPGGPHLPLTLIPPLLLLLWMAYAGVKTAWARRAPAAHPADYTATPPQQTVAAPAMKPSAWSPQRTRRLVIASAVVLGVIAVTLFAISYSETRHIVQETDRLVLRANELALTGTLNETSLATLDEIRARTDALGNFARYGAPLSMRFSFTNFGTLHARLRAAYFAAFSTMLFSRARAPLVAFLREGVNSSAASIDYESFYDALKAYLMITTHPERATPEFLARVLVNYLEADVPGDQALQLVMTQFGFLGYELPFGNPFAMQADDDMVEQARRYLSVWPEHERRYQALIRRSAGAEPPLRWSVAGFDVIANSIEVPAAFTRQGWQTAQLLLLNPQAELTTEEWVVPEAPAVDDRSLATVLRERYEADYLAAWLRFLEGARLVPFRDVPSAARTLQVMSGTLSPLVEFLSLIREHTVDIEAAGDTAGKMPTSSIAMTFQPVADLVSDSQFHTRQGAAYLAAIMALSESLNAVAAAPSSAADPNVVAAARQGISHMRNAADSLLASTSPRSLDPRVMMSLRTLLLAPAINAEAVLVGSVAPDTTAASGIAAFCAAFNALTRKFPFDANSTTEATIAEVEAMFAPGTGALWTFYRNEPQAFTTSPALGLFFANATAVARALFSDQQQLGFAFTLRGFYQSREAQVAPREVTVDFEGKPVAIRNERASVFRWTAGTAAASRATIIMGTDTIADARGPWAVFRVFHQATVTRTGDSWQATWQPAGVRPLTTTVTFENGVPILMRGYFALLRPCVITR